MINRTETLMIALAALAVGLIFEQLPHDAIRELLRATWEPWTWVLNLGARAAAHLLLFIGLVTYIRSGRRSKTVIVGLSLLVMLGLLQSTTARVEASPARLAPLLEHIALACLGFEFARQRRRK